MLTRHKTVAQSPSTVLGLTTALVLSVCTIAPAQPAAVQPLDLRPNWTPGQTSRYRITQTEINIQQIQNMTEALETTIQLEAEATWKIIDAPDNAPGGTAELTLDAIQMTLTDPSGDTLDEDGSSNNQATAPLRQWINAVTGSPLTVVVNPDGSIGKVEGYQPIQNKAGEAGQRLDEAYFREIAMDLAVLVKGPADAEPGDTWKHTHDSSHRLGAVTHNTTYELRGLETIAGIDIALIDRTAQLKLTPDLSDLPADAPPMNVRTTEATQSGQLLFDLSRHEMVGAHSEQTLAVEIQVNLAGRQLTRTSREVTSMQILRISEE